ncbi:MAG: hypothetical protein NXI18_08875 [Alphaproteobacteria bacterium]|nr:hypothetical protein [Alphaproteobacteria bacterium]
MEKFVIQVKIGGKWKTVKKPKDRQSAEELLEKVRAHLADLGADDVRLLLGRNGEGGNKITWKIYKKEEKLANSYVKNSDRTVYEENSAQEIPGYKQIKDKRQIRGAISFTFVIALFYIIYVSVFEDKPVSTADLALSEFVSCNEKSEKQFNELCVGRSLIVEARVYRENNEDNFEICFSNKILSDKIDQLEKCDNEYDVEILSGNKLKVGDIVNIGFIIEEKEHAFGDGQGSRGAIINTIMTHKEYVQEVENRKKEEERKITESIMYKDTPPNGNNIPDRVRNSQFWEIASVIYKCSVGYEMLMENADLNGDVELKKYFQDKKDAYGIVALASYSDIKDGDKYSIEFMRINRFEMKSAPEDARRNFMNVCDKSEKMIVDALRTLQ